MGRVGTEGLQFGGQAPRLGLRLGRQLRQLAHLLRAPVLDLAQRLGVLRRRRLGRLRPRAGGSG